MAIGSAVKGGMYGEVDLDDLLDGDVRPSVAPQARVGGLFARAIVTMAVVEIRPPDRSTL